MKMRILILEDENTKATRIKSVLSEKSYVSEQQIDIVPSIKDAVRQLMSEKYDLLITDMLIPCDYGTPTIENGGLELITTINKNPKIIAPQNIIVLTAHRELQEKYRKEVEKWSFDTIVYDSSSVEWENKIIDKVSYLQRVQESPQKRRKYNFDVAIITAVDREFNAVKQLSKWDKIEVEDDSTYFITATWTGKNGNIKVVCTKLPQMGMVAAATMSMKLIENFSPKYIIMPGIAAGLKDEYEFGDIILPREVKDYCSGKYSTPNNEAGKLEAQENPIKYFVPSAFSIHTEGDIVNYASADYSEILAEIHSKWIKQGQYRVPQIRTGYMASGDSVIQNDTIVKRMITNHLRHADGLDMEAYGLYYAASQAKRPKPIPICIKAISDFANKDKSDDHQEYAAYVSATFMKHFVQNVLPFE